MLKKTNNFLSLFTLLLFTLFSLSAKDHSFLDSPNNLSTAHYPKLYCSERSGILKSALLDSISSAQKSIVIFSFTLSDLDLIERLNKKAEEGIDVSIIVDKDHQGPILNNGSPLLTIHTRNKGDGRLHHKLLVIDEENIWIGSANFTSSAYKSQENLMTLFKSKTIAKAITQEKLVFKENHKREFKETPTEKVLSQKISYYLLPHAKFAATSTEKLFNKKGKEKLLSLINSAQKTIRIAMMVWTEPELQKAIVSAHMRGVKIEVLLASTNDTVAQALKNAGIFVTNNPNSNFMHNKFMWVDDNILVNGSSNWSKSSFSRNDESFIVIENLTLNQNIYLTNYWSMLLKAS